MPGQTSPEIAFRPIGIIRTPFADVEGMPIQSAGAAGIPGTIELDPDLVEGLADLEGFSHLILIYHLDRAPTAQLTTRSFLDARPHGVFATRAPVRPNPIGLSTVRLVGIEGSVLRIEDVDMLDGTPLLDLKPYIPGFDDRPEPRIGWYEGKLDNLATKRSDDRFRR